MSTTTTTATTEKTQQTTTQQQSTAQQKPEGLTREEVIELGKHLMFYRFYKKPEAYLHKLEQEFRKLGKEWRKIREKAIKELLLKGEVTLPAISIKAYKINIDALRNALYTFIDNLNIPSSLKAELKLKIDKYLSEIGTEVTSPKQIWDILRKELGDILSKPVLNLSELYSSIATYLAEQNVPQSTINKIIDELRQVFGPGQFYQINSLDELKEVISKIEQILKKYNVPVYETITKLIPVAIKEYKIVNPSEAYNVIVNTLFKNAPEVVKEYVYNLLKKELANKVEVSVSDIANSLEKVIKNAFNTSSELFRHIALIYALQKEIENKVHDRKKAMFLAEYLYKLYNILKSKIGEIPSGRKWIDIRIIDEIKNVINELAKKYGVKVYWWNNSPYVPGIGYLYAVKGASYGSGGGKFLVSFNPSIMSNLSIALSNINNTLVSTDILNKLGIPFSNVAAINKEEIENNVLNVLKQKGLVKEVTGVSYRPSVVIKVPGFIQNLDKYLSKYSPSRIIEKLQRFFAREIRNVFIPVYERYIVRLQLI